MNRCKQEGETVPTLCTHAYNHTQAHAHIPYTQEREDEKTSAMARAVTCRWQLSLGGVARCCIQAKIWFSTVAME